jgi:glutamate racemase
MFQAQGGGEIDVVVLACTHFPLLGDELRSAFPEPQWVDGGAGIARRIASLTREQPWPQHPPKGVLVFTDGAPRSALMSSLAHFGLSEVQSL